MYADILGPAVQNLMKLLANITLKFLSWYMAHTLIFFAEKMHCKSYSIFCSKTYLPGYVFENTLANVFVIYKLQLMTLCQTRPR